MLLFASSGQQLPAAIANRQQGSGLATAGPSSSRLAAAAQNRRRSRGRVHGHVHTQVAEPELSWQSLEAIFCQDDSALPWLSSLALQPTIQQRALTQLAVQLNDPPESVKEKEERRKRQDYYANVGDAIRTLREDFPLLFAQDLNYDVYSEDVVFKDPRNTVKGKKNYQRLFRAVRTFGRIFFSRIYIEVQRIWQPDDRTIRMRWKLHGVPRIPWEVEGIFDGVSNFKLNMEGKIYEHSVDNVILRDPPMGISPLWTNLQRIFSPQPQPCPGLSRCSEEAGPSPRERAAAYVSRFSFVRLYGAVLSYMQLSHSPAMEPGQG